MDYQRFTQHTNIKGFRSWLNPIQFYAVHPHTNRLFTATSMTSTYAAPPTYTQVAQQQPQHYSHTHQNHHHHQLSQHSFPPLHLSSSSTFTFPPFSSSSVMPPPPAPSSVQPPPPATSAVQSPPPATTSPVQSTPASVPSVSTSSVQPPSPSSSTAPLTDPAHLRPSQPIKGYKGEDYYVDERNNTWHFRPVLRPNPVTSSQGSHVISMCRKRDRRSQGSHEDSYGSGTTSNKFWGTAFHPIEDSCTEPPPPLPEDMTGIREVWKHNLSIEFQTIRELVRSNFCYIAMDTEFPGTVARPIGEFRTSSEYQYELIRVNCDLLKLIQLGITFLDKDGNFPHGITTWQFNFKFSLKEDMYAEDSIKMLTKCGIQFAKHESDGIDPKDFAYYMISSGMVLDDSVTWISFHSGYDLGHLYRILTGKCLPKTEEEFFADLKLYFPNIFDVKCLMSACKSMNGGLQECADILDVERVGYQHQAGSDSYVTGLAFFRMQEVFYDDTDPVEFNGCVFGLDCNYSKV